MKGIVVGGEAKGESANWSTGQRSKGLNLGILVVLFLLALWLFGHLLFAICHFCYSPPMSQPPVVEDWTYGPARWIGVGLIVALSAVGLSWSLSSSRATPAGAAISTPKPEPVKSAAKPSAPAVAPVAPASESKPKASGPIVTELPAAAPVVATAPTVSAPSAAPVAAKPPAKINVNTASQAELELLPGVGPKLAQRILDDRAKNGNYKSLKDLDRVSGIGVKTLERLAPLVTFE